MSADLIKVLIDGASLVIAIGAMYYAWFANRHKEFREGLDELTSRANEIDLRVTKLEQTVGELPGRKDVHRLELMLTGMGGDLKAISATMDGMSKSLQRTEDIVSRHEDHLRENH